MYILKQVRRAHTATTRKHRIKKKEDSYEITFSFWFPFISFDLNRFLFFSLVDFKSFNIHRMSMLFYCNECFAIELPYQTICIVRIRANVVGRRKCVLVVCGMNQQQMQWPRKRKRQVA